MDPFTAAPWPDPEREALRVQAAAVAAQQAALTDEEIHLQQRRAALEQQEQQLAAHLEAKRQRLQDLHDRTRQNREDLLKERAAYERRVGEVTRDLAQSRRELQAEHRDLQAERRRLRKLRERLRARGHRLLKDERARLQREAAELHALRQDLEEAGGRLHDEKASFEAARLRLNGELELTRQRLREEQARWAEQKAAEEAVLRERADAVQQREARLTAEQARVTTELRTAVTRCVRLRQEADGLECRVRNQRRLLVEGAVAERRPEAAPEPAAPVRRPDPPEEALKLLERLTDELADQRLLLAEQAERLALARCDWQGGCAIVAVELEVLARDYEERERVLLGEEDSLREREQEALRRRRLLESWQARLAGETAVWDAERERLRAECRLRAEELEGSLAATSELRQRWEEETRRLRQQLQDERDACETLRREWAAEREAWFQRSARLEQLQRSLAGQALALEQYKQECVSQAADPRRAEKRLQRLHRRAASRSDAAAREFDRQRQLLAAEAGRLRRLHEQLHERAELVTEREAQLSQRHTEWEEQQLLAEIEHRRRRQELQTLQVQRESYERQVVELREEIDRLARLLLDDGQAELRVVQAA
jgi:hypothetical protein